LAHPTGASVLKLLTLSILVIDFHNFHAEMVAMVDHIGNIIGYEKGYERWRGTNSRILRSRAFSSLAFMVTGTDYI
jgi:hypothetical protein